ncbi:transcriptional regulator OPI1 KNAG_0C05540 [Huiozyma naganishii CBS 8797]|uniref:Transcriptional regulator OPI1 n=1 Tax=Huiozyma naganishii (strain ATCC MYA-139 / BCRC 22969 / CBS 8797 / KCTC 17520 / NBRC 10181 / NCYC 3082 / Yp74L-3) TaxID=1071383 RepID=J7RX72_HUIN7|nr:hypothetical protein KNAG_0C05540 [Kazachstania naganishii CBS 8797]CCK69652.1 hypothetical protein KNAG_0C05540 [Kazachstania naganishii CBS 8797]
MSLNRHPGLSEEDVEAAEVLDELRKAGINRSRSATDASQAAADGGETREGSTLLDRVVNNVVTLYDEMSNRKRVASIARLLDDAYDENYTTSGEESGSDDEEDEEDEEEEDDGVDHNRKVRGGSHRDVEQSDDDDSSSVVSESRISKRQKIADAIDNLKEYKLNMSIESKKRLFTCLHLLKLANKQLSDKVTYLQDLVQKEDDASYKAGHRQNPNTARLHTQNPVKHEHEETEDRFFDAFDSTETEEQATVIKMEVVGTIKKVYHMISRFTGSSLPEPARSQVRETLLNLPTNWSSSVSNLIPNEPSGTAGATRVPPKSYIYETSKRGRSDTNSSGDMTNHALTTNGKVLILAKESLDMVQNVMDVVDTTLGRAEEWVKHKQEAKENIYERFKGERKDST